MVDAINTVVAFLPPSLPLKLPSALPILNSRGCRRLLCTHTHTHESPLCALVVMPTNEPYRNFCNDMPH
jgi:hypothetical protein